MHEHTHRSIGAPDAVPGSQNDTRLMVLRLLEQDPNLSQRALAQRLGVSLGKAHYLLQALLGKGLLKMRNFERSDHKMAYCYLLTPAGVVEKARMTREFLRRKEEQFQLLRVLIDQLHRELESVGSPSSSESSPINDRDFSST
jgi:EPS-associated MarR family transcriptional regulator